MRSRRKGRRPPRRELVGPRLCGRDDAVAALRVSAAGVAAESIVVLICDAEARVLVATEFEDGPAAGVATVVDVVLAAAPPGSALVVGVFRQDGTELDRLELEAVEEAVLSCAVSGVRLVDVLVLDGASEPVESVAGDGYEVDNGDQ